MLPLLVSALNLTLACWNVRLQTLVAASYVASPAGSPSGLSYLPEELYAHHALSCTYLRVQHYVSAVITAL
jgi:hypothetical protein